MTDVTSAAELIDRVAQKINRMRGVVGVTYSDRRFEVHLTNGQVVVFAVEVRS